MVFVALTVGASCEVHLTITLPVADATTLPFTLTVAKPDVIDQTTDLFVAPEGV